MRTCIDLPEALTRDVRVQLRGGDAGVTQQLLDDSQVGTALEQVRGETMTQRVRRDTARRVRPAAPWLA